MQTNPVVVFGEAVTDKKKNENFIIRFAAH